MKVLIANYRYFISGGPERYMFNLKDALIARGHEVIPFSIHYTKNQATPYSKYFVEPLGTRDEVIFREQRLNIKTFLRSFSRLFYARDVEYAITRLVSETKPQVAYILHYLRKLSPSLLVGLKKARIPIVVRLSDFAMVCPQAHCLLQNFPCEQCVKGNILQSIRKRCVQGSFKASLINALATWYHRFQNYFDLVDIFITTNLFMYDMMVNAGYPKNRLKFVPTFVDGQTFHPSWKFTKSDYVAFSGRLESIKGVDVLLRALEIIKNKKPNLKFSLKIIGSGSKDYLTKVKQKVQQKGLNDRVQFIGNLDAIRLSDMLSKALFSVVPSIWYENLPNSILESYACGTPVIASNIGSLSESIKVGETGFLFKLGDAEDLAQKMELCFNNKTLLKEMAFKSREEALKKYSPDFHVNSLIDIFNKYI